MRHSRERATRWANSSWRCAKAHADSHECTRTHTPAHARERPRVRTVAHMHTPLRTQVRAEGGMSSVEKINELLAAADTDRDGIVSLDELRTTLHQLGESLRRETSPHDMGSVRDATHDAHRAAATCSVQRTIQCAPCTMQRANLQRRNLIHSIRGVSDQPLCAASANQTAPRMLVDCVFRGTAAGFRTANPVYDARHRRCARSPAAVRLDCEMFQSAARLGLRCVL